MSFKNWLITESSLSELFQSTVDAFPNTTKRQHATDTINIANIIWRPFLGMRTLFVRALAQNEGKEYSPIIVFKNVRYHQNEEPNLIKITENGNDYFFEPLSMETDVILRCPCADFYWRGVHFNHLDKSLYGRDRKRYEAMHNPGSSNPTQSPIMCKHLIKLASVLQNHVIG
jgi:hypothetical protein